MFVMMSCKRKRDYKKVMQAVQRLPPQQPAVERLVIDFEALRVASYPPGIFFHSQGREKD